MGCQSLILLRVADPARCRVRLKKRRNLQVMFAQPMI
jgi:hypothetical protein